MLESNQPGSNAGITITDISIRYSEQVVLLDSFDPEEVLAESKLRLTFTADGNLHDKKAVYLLQSWNPFLGKYKTDEQEITNTGVGGRYGLDINLHNGINKFTIKFVGSDDVVLAESKFELQYKGSFREWNETIFIAFFLAILIRGLVIQAFWIPTGSMEPTLYGEHKNPVTKKVDRGGDRILVNRFAYSFDFSLDGRLPFGSKYWVRKPERGDIVVFRYPDKNPKAEPKDYIKRVIGLPGDTVEIDDYGNVLVNGIPLTEPYIKEPPLYPFPANGIPYKVPDDSLFVLGDNRNNSADSRYWGDMPLKNLKGQAIFNYLPINRFSPIRSYKHNLKDYNKSSNTK